MEWNGMRLNVIDSNGMRMNEWNEYEWNGMESLNGME